MHWIDKLTTPIIFGHRGASLYAPENTMAAFNLTLQQGAEAIELDSMLTADNVPIVIHDHTVDRTTDGRGAVDQFIFDEIRKLDAGAYFSGKFSGEKIPTLEEVFESFKGKALINLELKNYHAPKDQLPEIVVDLAKRMDVFDQIIFSSFLPSNLKKIKRMVPDARVALLCLKGLSGFLERSFLFMPISRDYINPHFKDVTSKYSHRQNKLHRKVNAWTVNTQEEMVRLFNLGINGIITDDPITAVQIKTEMKKLI